MQSHKVNSKKSKLTESHKVNFKKSMLTESHKVNFKKSKLTESHKVNFKKSKLSVDCIYARASAKFFLLFLHLAFCIYS